MAFAVDGARLIKDLEDLRTFGDVGKGGSRLALSAEDVAARHWLRDRMEAAGLVAFVDGIGNVFGYTPGADRYLLLGSHTDTVPMGGWLDGALGVMTGLEIARSFVEAGCPGPIGIAVVSFTDEEGTFLSLLGSRLFTGDVTLEEAAACVDSEGRVFSEAYAASGFAGREIERFDPQRHIGYLEIHIEQGPVLEGEGKAIGIVTDIVAMGRSRVIFHGRADHAGTTPMAVRADAAQALYEFATMFRRFVLEHGDKACVFNLGGAKISPGAFNVVAERAELLVEYRSPDEGVIDRIEREIPVLAQAAATAAQATVTIETEGRDAAAPMTGTMIEQLTAAAERLQISARPMISGAGHDAMRLAKVTPSGMLFIPSIGGRSHTPEENSTAEDIIAGLRVMADAVATIIRG